METSSRIDEKTCSLTNLEAALSIADKTSASTAETIGKLLGLVKSCHRATGGGDLKSLHRALESMPGQLAKVQEALNELQSSWSHSEQDEERYFAEGGYTRELLAAAREAGLSLADQDGVLACYPSLLRVNSRERALMIDRKLSREIRPSRLVAKLAENQKRPSSLKIAPFLTSLHRAYQHLCGKPQGDMCKLLDIYEMWTMRPGGKKDYSLQEFARDIYLLDASGTQQTPDGVNFRLHPGATAAKNRANLLVVVTREGVERTYFSIEFF